MDEYRATNRANWDDRAAAHAVAPSYHVDRLVEDPDALSEVVAFDAPYLGDVAGLDLLHLQCHIGTDTLSWAKLGAHVTGLDFSAASLAQARAIADRMGVAAEWVEAEFYDAPAALGGRQFDVVYTGVGALCWLPDIAGWARVVASCLRPGGRLLVREGHPMMWALDDERDDDVLALRYPYFETDEPNRFDDGGTYAEVPEGTTFETATTYDWSHGIGEILTAVLDAGLVIEGFEEHRFLDWQPWELFEPIPDTGLYRLPERLSDRVPLAYTLQARRPGA